MYGKKLDAIESLNSYKLHLELRLNRLEEFISSPPRLISDRNLVSDWLQGIDENSNFESSTAIILGRLTLALYLMTKKSKFSFSE